MKLLAVLVPVLLVAAVQAVTGDCRGRVLRQFTFPLIPYTVLNPFLANDTDYQALESQLVDGACDPDRDAGQVCALTPAFGSGLANANGAALPGSIVNAEVLGMTDRGPNQDCEDLCDIDPEKYVDACGKSGKGFPVPNFAPAFVEFTLNLNSSVEIASATFFKTLSGNPMSGVSNTEFDDTPYAPDCVGEPLPLDPNGIDPEDFAIISGTGGVMAVVEEYSPSILLSKPDGTVFARYVPASIAPLLADADTNVYGSIPDVFKLRRKNRGFENVVVTPDGSTVIAILQSPMGDRDIPRLDANRIARAVVMNVNVTGDDVEPVTLSFSHTFIIEFSPVTAYFDSGNEPSTLKFSAAQAIDADSFLILERADDQVKWFNIRWTDATPLEDTIYAGNLQLELETAGTMNPRELGVVPADKIKVMDTDGNVPGGIINFMGSDKQEGLMLLNRGGQLLAIDDNDFGLGNQGPMVASQLLAGRRIEGPSVCSRPQVPSPPRKRSQAGSSFGFGQISVLGDEFDLAKSEIVALDKRTNTLYTANADDGTVDALGRVPLGQRVLASLSAGNETGINSVDVCMTDGLVAAAVEDKTGGPGTLLIAQGVIGDNNQVTNITEVASFTPENCFLPDAIKWASDCSYVVIACEGEEEEDIPAQVPGGVLVWSALTNSVTVATFDAYDSDALKQALTAAGVRYSFLSDSPSIALEPEYSAYTMDNGYVWVTLQENNAFAVVDLAEARVTEIRPLIYTPRNVEGYGIDASDEDGEINIRTYPNLFGMCQPDAIASFQIDGENFFAVACEGDAYPGDVEEIRAGDIQEDLGRNIAGVLQPLVADPALLGRLEVSYPMGFNNATNTQEQLYHFGARSFQIYAMNGTCLVDSGDWIEQIHAIAYPEIFNAQVEEDNAMVDNLDSRSDAKGAETESVTVAEIDGRMILFVGNERTSTLMAFDVSNPRAPTFLAHTLRLPTQIPTDQLFATGQQGIMDPESLAYLDGFLYVGAPLASTVGRIRFNLGNSTEPVTNGTVAVPAN